MKAAVFNGIRDITIEEVEKPIAGPGEFILKVKAAALCGSDLRTYQHGHPKITTPQILGHEFSGIVDSVGENVTKIKVGDRVAVAPGMPCGSCYYCERGQQNMCENREIMGIHHPGAFAEYVKIPAKALESGTVVKLPDESSFELATLGDPLVACMNGQEVLDMKLGDTVVILGAGPIGVFHSMLAHLQGALKVVLADINETRLEFARKHKIADYCMNSKEEGFKDFVKSITDGRGADKVIVANTSPAAARQAVELVDKNGKVLLFAGFPKEAPQLGIDGNLIHYNQIRVVGSFGCTPRQYRLAQQLLSTKKIDGEILITHKISIEQINEGFQLMADGKALKVVIQL
jgi:L-iditol 2-dehydrogenase